MFAPPWPPADDEVRDALLRAYVSGDWGRYHGDHCEALRMKLADQFGVSRVTLCCSGTFAVELALRAAGVTAGDEVILAAYDFSGNFRAIEAVGARPVLVDVDPGTFSLDATQLDDALSPSVSAIIVSHLHGRLAPIGDVRRFADHHGLMLVEDACQCPGATIDGLPAGAIGHVGVLSFGGSKLLTAGRGGALLTTDEALHQRAKVFANRGNDAFALSELQAAVLAPQLDRLAERNTRRAAAVARLMAALANSPQLDVPRPLTETYRPTYYKLGMHFRATDRSGRADFITAAQKRGLPIDAGFRGFARRSSRRCRRVGDLPHAAATADDMLVLHHPVLLEPDDVIDQLAVAMIETVSELAPEDSGTS